MAIPFAVVDAFTDQPFAGNPASVCLLDRDYPDDWLLKVAKEFNLSETAFLWPRNNEFLLRWFTPTVEVDLCGHATLAAAHVLWHVLGSQNQSFTFQTRSGKLSATRKGTMIELDFPAVAATMVTINETIVEALDVRPVNFGVNGMDALIVVQTETEVRACEPDFRKLAKLPFRGVILTAQAEKFQAYDYVSRFFAPAAGVDEDPVTGSAHCCLAPYWSSLLKRDELTGFQASVRGGFVQTTVKGNRVMLAGHAVTVSRGELLV